MYNCIQRTRNTINIHACMDKASHLTVFCTWDSIPHLLITPVQLTRPGIGQNASYAVIDFVQHLSLPFFEGNVLHWLFMHVLSFEVKWNVLFLQLCHGHRTRGESGNQETISEWDVCVLSPLGCLYIVDTCSKICLTMKAEGGLFLSEKNYAHIQLFFQQADQRYSTILII